MIDCLKNINLGCMVEMPGLNARIQSAKGRRIKTLNATTPMTVGRCYATDATSDSPEPKDNQYYAWIQDLVARRRTLDDLANELRCHCIVISDDASHV